MSGRFRTIVGLQHAAQCLRPASIPKSRPRGAKAAGLRFERAVGAALPSATPGQWFEFLDSNGPGHCQMDLLLVGSRRVAVLECKLTDAEGGRAQLEGLYLPIARAVWPEKQALGVVVVRHLSRVADPQEAHSTLEDALLAAVRGPSLLHWIERTPIRWPKGRNYIIPRPVRSDERSEP